MARALAVFALALAAHAAVADLAVPPLTGRVVDRADVLSDATEAALTATLAAHEDSTSNQVVVLTVPSLEGEILEPYATGVFREWGLGQEDRDNGVLLLVAVEDRKVRIEVGYGLEGALTDATSGTIIRREIVPRFRDGDFDAGVIGGTEAILAAIAGEYDAGSGGGPSEMTWAERLAFGLAFGLFGPLVVGLMVTFGGGTGWTGDLGAGCLGVFGALFGAFGLGLATGSALVGLGVLVGLPIGLVVLNRWAEAHPKLGPMRRHRRAKQEAFRDARRRGAKTVVVDGRSYSVPTASASGGGGGGFSGGGGSSGGGGASGSW